MGYPPIPMTTKPYIVAARAEVNSQVDYRDVPHVHWVLSTMARGGFSGAMVIDERGIALGVVSRSVLSGVGPEELGYMSATSVEPIYQLLAAAKMLPQCQSEHWDGFWNSDFIGLEQPSPDGWGGQTVAYVERYDDGKVLWLKIRVHENPELQKSAVALALERLNSDSVKVFETEGVACIQFATYDPSEEQDLQAVAEAVLEFLEGNMRGVRRSGIPQHWII